jgi:hypothetical protein
MTSPAMSTDSLYFDAPISHFSMQPALNDDSSDSASGGCAPPVVQVVAAEELKPSEFVYVDGNWVVKNPPGVENTAATSHSPTMAALAPTEGQRRRAVSASMNGSMTTTTTRRGRSSIRSVRTVGSAFANGPGTTGPAATPDLDKRMRMRAASADASLTAKQRSKIVKEECT